MNAYNVICPSQQFTRAIKENGQRNPKLTAKTPLTASEIRCVRELLRGRPNTLFTVQQLFGLYWDYIIAPRKFGLRFKESVAKGVVPGVYCCEATRGKTKLYRQMDSHVVKPPSIPRSSAVASVADSRLNEVAHAASYRRESTG